MLCWLACLADGKEGGVALSATVRGGARADARWRACARSAFACCFVAPGVSCVRAALDVVDNRAARRSPAPYSTQARWDLGTPGEKTALPHECHACMNVWMYECHACMHACMYAPPVPQVCPPRVPEPSACKAGDECTKCGSGGLDTIIQRQPAPSIKDSTAI